MSLFNPNEISPVTPKIVSAMVDDKNKKIQKELDDFMLYLNQHGLRCTINKIKIPESININSLLMEHSDTNDEKDITIEYVLECQKAILLN